MIKVYGIPNCDTIKKARRWLEANGVERACHMDHLCGQQLEVLDKNMVMFYRAVYGSLQPCPTARSVQVVGLVELKVQD